MQSKKKRVYVYLSFWDICLENFPTGIISHTILSPEEAKNLIARAKKDKQLFYVVSPPYQNDGPSCVQQLCNVLRRHYDIKISPKDFLHKWGTGKKIEMHPFPLNGVTIKEKDQLLVVSNNFTLDEEHKGNDKPHFGIVTESIKFHLFQYEKTEAPIA